MIIVVASLKGGSGKSTAAYCLAELLALEGREVLLLDADPQRTLLEWNSLRTTPLPRLWLKEGFGELPASLGYKKDLVIIDTAPRVTVELQQALGLADMVLVPTRPTAADVSSLSGTLEVVRQKGKKDLETHILLTQVHATAAIGADVRSSLERQNLPVLKAKLGVRVDFQQAPFFGQGVCSYSSRSAAAQEVRSLARELRLL